MNANVISRPVMLLLGFLLAVTGTVVVTQVVTQASANASYTACNSHHGSLGWTCLDGGTATDGELWISQNSHYCVNLPPWNDEAEFVSNQFATRIIRVYVNTDCDNATPWTQLQPGTNWTIPLFGTFWHSISSVYLYS